MSLQATPLLTRDAEGLFWMARYLERVENLARLIDVTQTFESPGREDESWAGLLAINSDKVDGRPDAMAIKRFYLLDHANPTGVPFAIEAARTNARKLRPLISTEMWMQLNVFHRDVMSIGDWELDGDSLSRLCRRLKEGVQAHTGVTEGTFFRDQGWRFYELGRLIERADQTTRLLDIKYHVLVRGTGPEERRLVELTQWNAVLRAAAGYHAFRRVAETGFQPADVVNFLLGDTAFARSVALCVEQMEVHLNALRTRYGLRDTAPVLARLDELGAMLNDLSHLRPERLHDFLDRLQKDLNDTGNIIGTMFFRDWRPLLNQQQGPTGMTQTMGGMTQSMG